ncbi:hypothetical protein [Streptomyces sp. NPDC048340]|uniref:hypothetical protein n=1 Tax=Streptomyces sp. NPDC048340 TaxID=3365537 RepID=UPI00371E7CEE
MPQIDTRLVQTAVIGGRDSDVPVILPEEPHNLDEFRLRFGTDRYWCGTLLGGCGEKLMTKRYETKVCHFSHYPDRDGVRAVCHRSANGVDSADHLFIRMHVKEWLAGQGHAAQSELRSFGDGPGDAVDFWLRATGQHLRFVLRPQDYRSWRGTADSLGAKEGHVDWVFRSEAAVTREMTARQGYALRVRCETAGADRRVLIGTATGEGPVAWEPLEQCRMTRDGLLTPALEELRAAGRVRQGGLREHPLPASLPLPGAEIIFAVDSDMRPPAGAALAIEGRYQVSGFAKPAGSRIVRACLSLPDGYPTPSEQYVYQLSGPVRLLVTDPVAGGASSWAIRADGLIPLRGLDAERTGLWRPSVALLDGTPPAPRKPAAEAAPEAESKPERHASLPKRGTQAAVLRRELERLAAERATATWTQLSRHLGLDLAHLPEQKRRDLLVEVDTPLEPGGPLLSVLVTAPTGRILPYLGTVLRMLGASAPASEVGLQRWSVAEIEKTHKAYSGVPAVKRSAPPAPRGNPAPATDPVAPSERLATERMLGELRRKVADATILLPKATARRGERLRKATGQARTHMAGHSAALGQRRTVAPWLRTGGQILDELTRLIGHPVGNPKSAPAPSSRAAVPKTASAPLVEAAVPKATRTKPRESGPAERPAEPTHAIGPKAVAGGQIDRIAARFEEAKRHGDLKEAKKLQHEAEGLNGKQVAADAKPRLRKLCAELAEWIGPRDSEEAQGALRTLLEGVTRSGSTPGALELRTTLAYAKILRRRCRSTVPADVQALLDSLTARIEGTAVAPGAEGAPPTRENRPTDPEVLAQFEWLVEEIRTARSADDLPAVRTARGLAGPLYGRKLSEADRERYASFMREVKAWCAERNPVKQVDPAVRRIRLLLAGLSDPGWKPSVDELRAVLDEITRLRSGPGVALSPSEEGALRRWNGRLKHRERGVERSAGVRPAGTAALAEKAATGRQGDRLPAQTVEQLAAKARKVLADTARSGGSVLTWGALRSRMGGTLPHLHPDDQGELLVAVDRETPAGDPLLSTLIASADASLHWLYRHVRFSLGRERIPDAELEAHWATEVLRLRQQWRHR